VVMIYVQVCTRSSLLLRLTVVGAFRNFYFYKNKNSPKYVLYVYKNKKVFRNFYFYKNKCQVDVGRSIFI
jgi:hypothetical protein